MRPARSRSVPPLERFQLFELADREVESEADLREAIACGADLIMLDNQDVGSLKRLVEVARSIRPDVVLEASGGVSLGSVKAIAETGVDLISSSALTMGAPPVDVSLTLQMGG